MPKEKVGILTNNIYLGDIMAKQRFRLIMNCGNCRHYMHLTGNTGDCRLKWKMVREYNECCKDYEYKGKGEPKCL